MILTDYGYDERTNVFATEFTNLKPARVILQEKGMYYIISEMGEQWAQISGKFRYDALTVSDYPAVGDFVMVDNNSGDTAVIHSVLPRKSIFTRKASGTGNEEQVIAANIDIAFICMSLNLNFNIRRLERYLSVAWDSGARPVIVLTKADLCEDIKEKIAEAESVAIGVDILTVSFLEEDGYKSVLQYITPGKTVAFIGSSGVGKSTLINCLIGKEKLETSEIGNEDKGRHTTTHKELILLQSGGIAIDTPGMRELGMWDSEEGVEKTFLDIEEISLKCKFSNCTHNGEPGCAIRKSIENGTIDKNRWASYLKLKQENEYSLDSESYLASKEEKFKQIAKINKVNRKNMV